MEESSDSTPVAAKTTGAATKSAKGSSRKPVASSTSGSSTSGSSSRNRSRSAANPSTSASQKTKATANDADKAVSSHSKSNKTPVLSTDSGVQPSPVVDQSASLNGSLNDSVPPEPSVDGVYVSRETVREQAAAEQAPSVVDDAESQNPDGSITAHPEDAALPEDAAHPERDSAAGAVDETTESVDGAMPHPTEELDAHPQEDAPEAVATADVSHETEGEADDASSDLVPVPGTTFGEISLDRIRPNPRQPRDVFDEDALDELITSIREIGVLQPVVVRRRADASGQYELIMGERRFRASKDAGKTTIPAIVRETSNDDLLRDALLENLHRVDLNPLEEAAAYSQLLEDFNCTQEELSERIGRSRPQISNTIRLLKLPAMVQRRVAAGVLSSGHARAILGLNDAANMEVLAQRVVAEGLSVRATEEAVVLLNRGERSAVSRGTRKPDPELAELARSLGDRLDTRVNLVMGKRKGKLSVEFANGEDLSRILSLLGLDGGATEE
ncbi:ParB/RepB/Spo0J family partition protein [Brevibacterium jeotgali]|nr:ParB/RepB/Spo0J family partition protein [Brevibacterium jeotgali]